MDKKKANNRLVKILAYVLAFLMIVIVGGYFLLPLGGLGALAWIIISVYALFRLVRWHASALLYCCSECGNIYEVSGFVDVFIPYLNERNQGEGNAVKITWCPYCKKNTKADVTTK